MGRRCARPPPGGGGERLPEFSRDDLVRAEPAALANIWIDNHPMVVQRIAMARAYAAGRH